jgi:hypothetical protein
LTLKGFLGTVAPSILEKRVAGAVVGASCGSGERLRTGVRGVAGSIRRSSIGTSVLGARQHLAVATALDLSALLALIIASACSFVFGGPLRVGRRGHLRSSARWGPPQWRHFAGHWWGGKAIQLEVCFASSCWLDPQMRQWGRREHVRALCHWKQLVHCTTFGLYIILCKLTIVPRIRKVLGSG